MADDHGNPGIDQDDAEYETILRIMRTLTEGIDYSPQDPDGTVNMPAAIGVLAANMARHLVGIEDRLMRLELGVGDDHSGGPEAL